MAVLNWCYGASAPTQNANIVSDQIWHAHKYKNKLIELERLRREAAEKLAVSLHPPFAAAVEDYHAAQAAVDAAYTAVKQERIRQRKRVPPTPEQQSVIDAAKERRAIAYAAVQKHKAEAYAAVQESQQPHFVAATQAIEAEIVLEERTVSDAAKKRRITAEFHRRLTDVGLGAGEPEYAAAAIQARAQTETYWGTYLQVEDAAKDFRKGAPPKFRRWHPDGSVSVQLQGGLTVQKAAEGEDTRLRLFLPEITERLATKGQDKGTRCEGEAWIRVQSNGRDPVWAVVPFRMHRPLPADGVIKWAHLDRRMAGETAEWTLRLTLETSRTLPSASDQHTMLAVHIGHHQGDGGLVVATWTASDGKRGELVLPDDLIQKFTRPAELDATREANANVAMAELLAWIKSTDPQDDWFRAQTENLVHWKGPERLAKLVAAWRDNRFDGDQVPATVEQFPGLLQWAKHKIQTYREKGVPIQTDISSVFLLFEFWRKQDKHLGQWIKSQMKKCSRVRKHLYGEFAANMAKRYHNVVIANINWKQLAETPEVDEDDKYDSSTQRRIARIASPGILSETLVGRFANAVKLPAKNIKATCHLCGYVNKWTHTRDRHTCKNCGKSWEIRKNTLANIYAIGQATLQKNAEETVDQDGEIRTARKGRRNRRKGQVL